MTIQVTNDNKIEQSIMTMEYSDWKLSAITELEEQGHHLRVGEKSRNQVIINLNQDYKSIVSG